ncbi:MAG: ABC transporter ATP-binding protein [Armatimonadota bacterium]|nr:ABC transporter ATP-binding protein [Armatimonadota bacterium]
MASAIRTEGLTKEYVSASAARVHLALKDLTMEVEEGEIFGFLGPNGAGKTTTIKILLGLIFPTAGRAWVLGKDLWDTSVKYDIAFVPDSPYFYDFLTAEELLRFYGRLFGLKGAELQKRIDSLLELVGMTGARNRRLREYSRGMFQRVGIAQALVNDPKVLLLDEPTSGLDPIAQREVRDVILKLRQQGKTILLCSHHLSDVERISDRVGILNQGRLERVGRLDDLLAAERVEIVAEGLSEEAVRKIESLAQESTAAGGRVVVYEERQDVIGAIVDIVRGDKARLVSLIPQRQTLEDLFIRIVRQQEGSLPQEVQA